MPSQPKNNSPICLAPRATQPQLGELVLARESYANPSAPLPSCAENPRGPGLSVQHVAQPKNAVGKRAIDARDGFGALRNGMTKRKIGWFL